MVKIYLVLTISLFISGYLTAHRNLDKCHERRWKYPVTSTNCVQDLGFLIEEDLNFSMHLDKLLNDAKKIIFFIFRSFKTRSADILLPVYKSLVVSFFEFSSLVLPKGISEQQCKIENIQKKFTQILLQHKQPRLTYEQRLKTLGLTTLQRRSDRGIIHFLQKLILSNHNELIDLTLQNCKFQELDVYTSLSSYSGKKYQST